MSFIAIIICLAVDQWTDVGGKVREHDYTQPVLVKFIGFLEKAGLKSPAVNLGIVLATVFIATAIIFGALNTIFFGLLGFLFALAVLYYCLSGFQYRSAESVDDVLSSALEGVFSVIFWFFLLGPMGALLYRATSELTAVTDQAELSGKAQVVQAVMDWIPSRLLSLCFAIVGSFGAVIKVWMSKVVSDLEMNKTILFDCAQVAFSKDKSEGDLVERDYVVKLVDRALIAWLVIFALLVLIYL